MIEWSIAARPMAGQTISGDLHVVEHLECGALLAVIDGVGHGNEAGLAARKAADILKQHNGESLIGLVRRCHKALAETRGVVMTMALIDAVENTVTWLGVGNVEARLFRAAADTSPAVESIILRGGLVGLQLPALQASVMPMFTGDVLVFATDGVAAGFDQSIYVAESPQQTAARIMERHFKGTDDALVLVVRYLGAQHNE